MPQSRARKVLVVGAGPVGALTALSLHRRGWEVEVWESRDDPRGQDAAPSNLRSINLAISSRGLEALRSVDPSIAENFLEEAIPMKGRMIHHTDGKQESQLYDPIGGQSINSISRPILNQRLVQSLPETIKLRFNTKLKHIDFKNRVAYASHKQEATLLPGEESGKDKKESTEDEDDGTAFDLVIGCDGSWSKVRTAMMRAERIDFSQSFIPHAYIELHMPSNPDFPGGYAMDKNHLHIWPRHAFMLIGLPNKDGSFTLTLFIPFSSLELLNTRESAATFFREHFPSAVDIVGEKVLLDDFEKNPRGNLVTINCTPSAWSSHAILLGDASHSMVPFYGQGLNCGLEDVRVLSSILERHHISSTTTLALGETDPELELALKAYSDERQGDLKAICELALQNYTEMRSHVLSPLHHLRRQVDKLFTTLLRSAPQATLSLTEPFPTKRVRGWTSLYEMVTFRPDVGYSEALRKERWQKDVVGYTGWVGGVIGIGAAGVFAATMAKKWLERR
ncbi:kynurenine 3-monooxygenase [Cryptococcus neoformans A2-102-5]|nr:kynurenine 3-monooxygenase [Cryptococcus neoformans var. grubii AD1-83a]OXG64710.1 kynurenine 3-monooxygenase [Cryptococcus neoformans var. grubii MW-RSA1955]OXG67054.1 kynurenine 3-monooxygenase [Cryptococcus neoformans var. grubii c8]OXG69859.1 kynurenine 3-monooxygenase [Cryptococcus neoformans var. grubii CHC193]OXG90307.1 kynurenine 3-monooxygenase [Cryptococcus neoformans var. grubii D17-1]OXG98136.1 kynurenine 3-monooxygenase [Cryptococcus neoformans var. grubii A2-102-5]OXH15242.1 